jgi:hypothetical protein
MRPASPRTLVFRLTLLPLMLGLAACGRGSDRAEATPDDVDETTVAEITQQERAAFAAPRDSVLTSAQIEAYMKTSLLQFDLVRKHSERLHARFQEMQKREEKGGAVAGFRNLLDAGRTAVEAGDLIGGSYIRSARTLGYNPAEMEWVRERMGEVGLHLAMRPMHESALQGAQQLREQAEQLRQQLADSGDEASGFSEEHIKGLLEMANQAETGANQHMQEGRAVLANINVLQRTRPNVTEPMWSTIGITGGSSGLLVLTGLADPNDQEAQKKLDEYRRIFTDALANQVTPGMEKAPTP